MIGTGIEGATTYTIVFPLNPIRSMTQLYRLVYHRTYSFILSSSMVTGMLVFARFDSCAVNVLFASLLFYQVMFTLSSFTEVFFHSLLRSTVGRAELYRYS